MALFIVQISETDDRTILSGQYSDKQAAEQALKKVLAGYKHHGRNDEHGYWWARDDGGPRFKFVVESV